MSTSETTDNNVRYTEHERVTAALETLNDTIAAIESDIEACASSWNPLLMWSGERGHLNIKSTDTLKSMLVWLESQMMAQERVAVKYGASVVGVFGGLPYDEAAAHIANKLKTEALCVRMIELCRQRQNILDLQSRESQMETALTAAQKSLDGELSALG